MSTRRNFVKSLAALALTPFLAPAGCLDQCKAIPPLPANNKPRPYTKEAPGPYTKRATALAKRVMRNMDAAARNATHEFTDIYVNPKTMEDIRAWGCDQIDEESRKAIMLRGPLVCSAWGYDMSGKPNANGDIFHKDGEIDA